MEVREASTLIILLQIATTLAIGAYAVLSKDAHGKKAQGATRLS
jgi:hypothetical protein